MRQTITHRSRNLALTALLALALLPSQGFPQEGTLRIDQLRPGQTHIGRANIQNIVDQNADKTRKNNAKPENQANPRTALQTYAARMDSGERLPVIKAPDGTYVMLDGHHRTTSYWSIFEEAKSQWDQGNHAPGAPRPDTPSLRVHIKEDFSKKNWKEFATWMVEHKKVFFDQEILQQARKRRGVPQPNPTDPELERKNEEFIRANAEFLCRNYLPKDFKAMIDSPMRSVVGTVLYDLNIMWDAQQDKAGIKKADRKSLDGSNQVEYIEFLIGDHLKKRGIEGAVVRELERQGIRPPTLKGNEYNPSVLRMIEDAIFDDGAERAFLAASCRRQPVECNPADKVLVSEATEALYGIHNTKRASTPGGQPNANPAGVNPLPQQAAPGGP